jgi:hypothetical protein
MRARNQLALFLGAYVLYNLGRALTHGDMSLAVSNAQWVLDTEGRAAIEPRIQDAFGGVWMTVLSHIYLAAQLVVLPGALIALYRWSPRIYPRLRDTVIVTWLLSLPVYALFPVAPPRLAGIGMHDSVSDTSAVALAGHSTWFYNPIAAVPSLHCGFAVAVGIALSVAVRRPVARALWLLWGPLVCVAVVATGNHYVFDIAAGLLASVLGHLLGRLSARAPVRAHPLRPRRTA